MPHKWLGHVWQHVADAAPYYTPMACRDSITQANYSNDRYVFGYARDNSTFPKSHAVPKALVLIMRFLAAGA